MKIVVYAGLALLLNFFLFQFMAFLVARHQLRFKPVLHAHRIDFIRLPQPQVEHSPRPNRSAPKPPPPQTPPPVNQLVSEVKANIRQLPLPIPALRIDVPQVASTGIQVPSVPPLLVVGDPSQGGPGPIRVAPSYPDFIWASELTPIVQMSPVYPIQAKRRGIEGYVVLEFIVNESGEVQAPKVIESHPPGIFDQAALRAASYWRFKPKLKDGQPISVTVRQKLQFRLRRRG